MKSIYKHYLKLHFIFGSDRITFVGFPQLDLLFAYKAEIKISWIKLFAFQFILDFKCKMNAICSSSILLFYLHHVIEL